MSSSNDNPALAAENSQLKSEIEYMKQEIQNLMDKVRRLELEKRRSAVKPEVQTTQPTISTGSLDSTFQAENIELRAELAAKDAEIRNLKARMSAASHGCFSLYRQLSDVSDQTCPPSNVSSPPFSGQPSSVFGQPSNVLSQPSSVFGQPSNVLSRSSSVFGQPSRVFGQPSSVFGPRSQVAKQVEKGPESRAESESQESQKEPTQKVSIAPKDPTGKASSANTGETAGSQALTPLISTKTVSGPPKEVTGKASSANASTEPIVPQKRSFDEVAQTPPKPPLRGRALSRLGQKAPTISHAVMSVQKAALQPQGQQNPQAPRTRAQQAIRGRGSLRTRNQRAAVTSSQAGNSKQIPSDAKPFGGKVPQQSPVQEVTHKEDSQEAIDLVISSQVGSSKQVPSTADPGLDFEDVEFDWLKDTPSTVYYPYAG